MNPNSSYNSSDYAKYRFEKSLKMLETAKLAKDNDDYFSANNRLYYALFHAIRSVLALVKLISKSILMFLVILINTILQLIFLINLLGNW